MLGLFEGLAGVSSEGEGVGEIFIEGTAESFWGAGEPHAVVDTGIVDDAIDGTMGIEDSADGTGELFVVR